MSSSPLRFLKHKSVSSVELSPPTIRDDITSPNSHHLYRDITVTSPNHLSNSQGNNLQATHDTISPVRLDYISSQQQSAHIAGWFPFLLASMRRRGKWGNQRAALEVFNMAHAAWCGKNYTSDPTSHVISVDCDRQMRRKIRNYFYAKQSDGSLFIEQEI